jgi:YebC/PmpR family DNA-binding regulatory protein
VSGHSKWANIKHRKAGADKKRGSMFTKISKELMVAARLSGSDASSNPRLRIAISKAKAANMPRDNIERAIKKGAGELEGQVFEEILYEVYAPGGVGFLVEALTDKKSRTTPEIKSMLTKYGANLAEANAVSRLFQRKGYIFLESVSFSEEELMDIVIEAGAEDLRADEGGFEIITAPDKYAAVSEALAHKNIETKISGIRYLPLEGTEVKVENQEHFTKLEKLLDALDDNDDVQEVSHNMQIAESLVGQS